MQRTRFVRRAVLGAVAAIWSLCLVTTISSAGLNDRPGYALCPVEEFIFPFGLSQWMGESHPGAYVEAPSAAGVPVAGTEPFEAPPVGQVDCLNPFSGPVEDSSSPHGGQGASQIGSEESRPAALAPHAELPWEAYEEGDICSPDLDVDFDASDPHAAPAESSQEAARSTVDVAADQGHSIGLEEALRINAENDGLDNSQDGLDVSAAEIAQPIVDEISECEQPAGEDYEYYNDEFYDDESCDDEAFDEDEGYEYKPEFDRCEEADAVEETAAQKAAAEYYDEWECDDYRWEGSDCNSDEHDPCVADELDPCETEDFDTEGGDESDDDSCDEEYGCDNEYGYDEEDAWSDEHEYRYEEDERGEWYKQEDSEGAESWDEVDDCGCDGNENDKDEYGSEDDDCEDYFCDEYDCDEYRWDHDDDLNSEPVEEDPALPRGVENDIEEFEEIVEHDFPGMPEPSMADSQKGAITKLAERVWGAIRGTVDRAAEKIERWMDSSIQEPVAEPKDGAQEEEVPEIDAPEAGQPDPLDSHFLPYYQLPWDESLGL